MRALKVSKGTKKGDSISVDGVCLTVTEKKGNVFTFDIMKETLDKTTLGRRKKSDRGVFVQCNSKSHRQDKSYRKIAGLDRYVEKRIYYTAI